MQLLLVGAVQVTFQTSSVAEQPSADLAIVFALLVDNLHLGAAAAFAASAPAVAAAVGAIGAIGAVAAVAAVVAVAVATAAAAAVAAAAPAAVIQTSFSPTWSFLSVPFNYNRTFNLGAVVTWRDIGPMTRWFDSRRNRFFFVVRNLWVSSGAVKLETDLCEEHSRANRTNVELVHLARDEKTF